MLIGPAETAANIPLAVPAYKWDAGKGNYTVVGNIDFMSVRRTEHERATH